MINRVFSPKLYREYHFDSFISVTANKFVLQAQHTIDNYSYVEETQVSYYAFPLFDTSSISAADMGKKFLTYKCADQQTNWPTNRSYNNPIFKTLLVQSR